MITDNNIKKATEIISKAKHLTAFTGAGISVESGIPPFRGPNGLWSRYDPIILEINYFYQNPEESWRVIKEIFYDHFSKAQPNKAHYILAEWEKQGILKSIITQNIDNLHFIAGNTKVIEYHGNSRNLICTKCGKTHQSNENIFKKLPPTCECGGLLKPDFVFFGEGIPREAVIQSEHESNTCDVMLIIGSTGEIFPASTIPYNAKNNGAVIIEINPERTNFTNSITDIFIDKKATEALEILNNDIKRN